MVAVGGEESFFGFTVPDELLREAVARTRDPKAVAALEMIPGTGEGKPPPLMEILRAGGIAPQLRVRQEGP